MPVTIVRDILTDLNKNEPANPMKSAQQGMRPPLPKRFYSSVETAGVEGGFVVKLDGRPVKTPGQNLVRIPTETAAQLLADEFAAQGEHLDAMTMPVFRLLNSAIDGVAQDPQAVLEDIIRFAGADLLCYRADEPEGLVEKQCAAWDEPLAFVERETGQRFVLVAGVMHQAQKKELIAAFGALLKQASDPVTLASLHTMTTLTGSSVLAYNVYKGEMSAEEAWAAAHVDEDWNISLWGEDAEAAERRNTRWREMQAAADLLSALQN